MAAFGTVAFMLVAGWQFGVSGTDAVFSEKEVALENAISGSDDCTSPCLFCDKKNLTFKRGCKPAYGWICNLC